MDNCPVRLPGNPLTLAQAHRGDRLRALKPVVPDAFTAARLALPLIHVEVLA